VPRKATEQLWAIVFEQLLPALDTNDFAAFNDSLTQFNYACGLCFAARQGGGVCESVGSRHRGSLRSLACAGWDKVSWGPTVFALFENDDAAQQLQPRFEIECPWPARCAS